MPYDDIYKGRPRGSGPTDTDSDNGGYSFGGLQFGLDPNIFRQWTQQEIAKMQQRLDAIKADFARKNAEGYKWKFGEQQALEEEAQGIFNQIAKLKGDYKAQFGVDYDGDTWKPGDDDKPKEDPYKPQDFSLTDPTAFFDPKFIEQFFNTGRGNIARSAGGAVSAAQRTAGAQAGAGNYLNKGAFVNAAGSQARSPFAGAFGQLEQGRLGALQENQQGLFGALNNKALMEEQIRAARQGFDFTKEKDQRDYELMRQNYLKQWDLQNRQFGFQQKQWKDQNTPSWLDYLGLGAKTLGSIFCWIAEAIYGETDPRTHYARYAVTVMWERNMFSRMLKRLYGRYGRRVAAQIKKHPSLKLLFRPAFEIIWRQGRNELEAIRGYATIS